ncbi:hypothetical protein OPT61_g3484 [Boeremia exigua]|uniref:Uncharacterized protein n=1 Tax=Boeremia exigua TaxID=749465 RepID=A0ACC2IHR1_9PLEO|nr:hypothetical protein OPT61_g3484 [Boeremia exigua]
MVSQSGEVDIANVDCLMWRLANSGPHAQAAQFKRTWLGNTACSAVRHTGAPSVVVYMVPEGQAGSVDGAKGADGLDASGARTATVICLNCYISGRLL